MEIVEDGFKGGNVISANFSGTDKEIEIIRKNVIKSIWNGRLITKDGLRRCSCFITKQRPDVKNISDGLEKIRTSMRKMEIRFIFWGLQKLLEILLERQKVSRYFLLSVFLICCLLFYVRSGIITTYVLLRQ